MPRALAPCSAVVAPAAPAALVAPAVLAAPAALVALVALVATGGCASGVREGDEALAERYAREEARLIDEKVFAQARERGRVQRDARIRLGTDTVTAAPPLDIDPNVNDRWQFGTLIHPLRGEPVCAAVSGHGQPVPAPGMAATRLVVLGDGGHVASESALLAERTESAVRIDGGLPIPLELAADARTARLSLDPDRLIALLRAGTIATLDIAFEPAPVISDTLSSGATAPSPAGAPPGGVDGVERIVELDGLRPMLDELARCGSASVG